MIDRAFFRLVTWSVRKVGVFTLVSLFLLGVTLGSLVAGVEEISQRLEDTSLLLLAFLGMIVGWMLGRTQLRGRWASLVAAALGVFFTWVHVGRLGGKLAALLRASLQLAWQALRWRSASPPLDTSLVLFWLQDILGRTNIMLSRFFAWVGGLLAGGTALDLLASTMAWALGVWAVAAWAGWAVRRRGATLAAVLPAGVLGVIGFAYSRLEAGYLLPVLGGLFLLMSWTSFYTRQHGWQRAGTDYAEDIYFDTVMWTLVFVVSVVSFALLFSSFSPQKTFRAMRNWIRGRDDTVSQIGDSLGLEQRPGDYGIGASQRAGSLPREHLLGSGPELSHNVVMEIEILNASFAPLEYPTGAPAPFYRWRAFSNDIYTGRGWANSPTERVRYRANELADPDITWVDQIIEQKIRIVGDTGGYVYAVGGLLTVDQRYQVDWWSYEEQRLDLFGASLSNSERGLIYQVKSQMPIAGVEQLRGARGETPEWVLDRYLQLPDGVPQRVIDLAFRITSDAQTPYDQAQALEAYLRGYEYTLDVGAPPADRDVADYFLFDLKKGYCDYYATAMVVMARAVGLPARLVMGYATGAYRASSRTFIVTEADAHSWVDVYFPGIGWVEFEPTAGRPPIERPESLAPLEMAERIQIGIGLNAPAWLHWLAWGSIAVALFIVLLIAWPFFDMWRLGWLPVTRQGRALYRRLYRHGRRLAVQTQPGQTPHEFTGALTKQIRTLAEGMRWQEWFSQTEEEVDQLVVIYERLIYSSDPPDTEAHGQAIRIWRRLWRRLILARLIHFARYRGG